MKIVLTTLCLTLFTSSLWAQKLQKETEHYSVYFGPKQERQLGTSVDIFIGADDEQFYTYFTKGRDFEKEDRFETYVFKITEKEMIHARGSGSKT